MGMATLAFLPVIYGQNKRVHLANGPMAYWAHKCLHFFLKKLLQVVHFHFIFVSFSFCIVLSAIELFATKGQRLLSQLTCL